MKVLVTGGAGFIGSHLCEHLLRDGSAVAIIDNLNDFYSPAVKRRNLEEIRQAGPASFHEADITDLARVEQVLDQETPEAIIHLAARAGVRPSIEQPLLYEETNIRGTAVLLEAARRRGIQKFVFASSSSIYGVTNTVPFSEDDHLNLPISPYAATKIAGEKICYTYSHLYGMRITCLRLFTVYGPRQRPDLAIHKFTRMIDKGEPIPVFGDGSSGRDYTFVADIVDGFVRALARDDAYEIINLGNSSPVLLKDMIAALAKRIGREPEIRRLPDQPGDVPITFASISKARELLGYEPATEFPEGIDQFVDWYYRSQRCD